MLRDTQGALYRTIKCGKLIKCSNRNKHEFVSLLKSHFILILFVFTDQKESEIVRINIKQKDTEEKCRSESQQTPAVLH